MNRLAAVCIILSLCFISLVKQAAAQQQYGQSGRFSGAGASSGNVSYDRNGRPIPNQPKQDSLQHRDRYADSITIFYRHFDSTKIRKIDSSLNNFTRRFPQPYNYYTLGNFGTASHSLLFTPIMQSGWDAGFHQFDIYNFTLENTKIFQTTRPYTEIAYLIGNKAEQLLDFMHTQNRKSNFNFSFEYRFTNAPGTYKNQNASNNNLRFTTHYQSPNKRYENYFIFLSNKNASSENGGLKDPTRIDSLALNNPYELETRLGVAGVANPNPFSTTVNTGNVYKQSIFLFRQQYDFGKKDSLVTDSVTYKLFYARLRLQQNLILNTYNYNYYDNNVIDSQYQKYFNFNTILDTISFKDAWTNLTNEFAIITFPDKNNQSQFFKAGAGIQLMKGTFTDTLNSRTQNFHNIYLMGEYRNRTRNQKWDVEASGKLFLNGYNSGDYHAFISLQRQLSKRLGFLTLGFQNTNRTPSFIFNPNTAFPVSDKQNFAKENTTHLSAIYFNPKLSLTLNGDYYLMTNYTYFDSFFVASQYKKLFNFIHLSAEKKFKLSKYWNWYTELHVQQVTGNAPIHVPFILTRNRLAFEGNFYTNLFLSTGIEVRYYTNFEADNYSPFLGQFFYQTAYTTSNRPDVNLFFNFRIKGFKGFLQLENLNTINPAKGFTFDKYNFITPLYPERPLWFRFGVWWNFVN
jgi:hypothetical protein